MGGQRLKVSLLVDCWYPLLGKWKKSIDGWGGYRYQYPTITKSIAQRLQGEKALLSRLVFKGQANKVSVQAIVSCELRVESCCHQVILLHSNNSFSTSFSHLIA